MAHYIIPDIISNGDTSTTSGIVLNADDLLEIQNGGVATDVTFNSGGIIWVYSGGMVDNALVNVGGCMEVKNGASATGIVENGGWVDVQEGATVSFVSNTFSGLTLNDNQSATIHAGTTVNDIAVNPGGYLDIASGGTAIAILENGGNVWVHDDAGTNVMFIPNVLSGLVLSQNVTLHSGTTAVQITFSGDYKGDFMICSGGIANETTLEGGKIIVYSGGTANETVVNGNRMTVSSGGLANGTVVNSNGSMYVFEGGLADGAVVNNRGNMWVSSGGTANNTTVAKGGSMTVSSGGTANNITVSSGGSMWVSSGGVVNGAVLYRNFSVSDGVVVNSATVNSGGSMEVKGRGVADNATVNVGGSMQVRSGGVADNATVNVGGSMSVDNGGMATGIVENGGWVDVRNRNDANVTFQANTFSGLTLGDKQSASVHAGTTATETTLEKGARLEVYSGGVADHATVNSGGSMGVSSGGVANETTVNVGGKLSVTRGVAEETHVSSGGVLSVGNGGYAESTSLEYRGQMEVLYGGEARDVTMNRATTIRVTGGTVEGITVIGDMSSTRYIYISDNGLVLNVSQTGDSEIVISDGGKLRNGEEVGGNIHVQSGGTLESANCTGTVYVYGSGLVQDIQVTNLFGGMTIYGGGYARRIQAGGTVHVSSGGILEDSDITRTFHISSGGTAIGIRKNSWDDFNVLEGGLSLEAQIICGPQNVLSGGVASATELAGSGSQVVMSGGSVKETTLNNGGFLIVSRGGVATDVQAVRDGMIQVESGGRLRNVSLKTYNMMIVSEGGKAEDANVASGGVVYLLNGAVLGGHLQLADGAIVSAFEGGVIDFDLSKANNTTALVNDLSVITGAPNYTITVSADMAEGVYLLADGAADFAGTITVKDDTMRYGTLSVENPLVYGWNTYALNLNNGSLSLTVARNDVYHEAEQNEPEPEEIIVSSGAEIPSGETLVWENTDDIVRITSGAVLRDVEIPWGGTLILEEGAILQGTVRLGTDVRANGIVNATDANLELDISKRKEEYGILLDDLAFVTATSLSVIVDPDQNKGEYILAGNAQEFDGVLTVKSTDGMNRGTISEEQETLDYDITRYTLAKNEKNELVFIVSSNISDETDYILLYKNGRLVLAEESEYELTLSGQNEFDQMIVLGNGCAEQITLAGGGLLTVKAGGKVTGLRQEEGGSLRFDYAEGDSTVIDGFNQGGAFFVGNNVLENVRGENVTVSGNVSVRDYGGSGRFEAHDGVSITGTLSSEELVLSDVTMEGVSVSTDHASFHSGNRIDHCRLDGRGTINVMSDETYNYWFYDGTNVSNSVFTAPTVLCSGASVSDSVFKSYVSLLGGTLSNVAFDLADYQTARFKVMGHVTCEGDLLFTKQPEYCGGFFDMNGHSAIMDYTGREDRDEAMIRRDAFSEDTVFQLNLNEDQVIGTYAIATGAAQGIIDTYHISVNGSIIGTINGNNREFVNGNYSYVMSSEKDGNIFLTVDISDDAEESYSVVWYDADGTIRHGTVASDLTIGTDAFPQALVRNNGTLNNATLGSGGVLKVKKGGRVAGLRQEEGGSLRFDYAEGDTTVIDGFNQGGAFFVGNNVLENVRGENVTVSGNVSVRDYGGSGKFEAHDGVSITGTLSSEELVLSDVTMEGVSVSTYSGEFNSGSLIDHCQLNGTGYYNTENYRLNSGSTVSHSVFNTPVIINQDATVSDSVFNSFATLCGGIISNITFNAGYTLFGSVSLDGDITLNCSGGYLGNGDICFIVNGHTVNVNYRNRTVTDSGMFSVNCFSEDATFRLLFQKDQRIGTYTIAYDAGSLVDSFLINIGGEDTEYLSYENPEMTFGNYRYTLAHDVETQLITLTIDVSEDADETFGVCYDGPEDEFLHSASLDDMEFRQSGYHNLTVRNGGAITNSTLGDTLLTVKAGGKVTGLRQEEGGSLRFDYAEGDSTVIDGFNQGGAFFVGNNVLENVRGENVTVSGNVSVRDYGGSGKFEAHDGVSITGALSSEELVLSDVTLEGVSVSTYSGEFNSGSLIDHCQLNGTGYYNTENYRLNSGSTVSHSVFNTPVIINQDATVSDSVFNSVSNSLFTELTDAIFFGGTLSEIVINGGWSVRGFISLDGDLTLRSTGWRFDSGDLGIDTASQVSSGIDGNGFTVNLDLTERTEADSELLTLSKLYNTELRVVMDPRQAIGTYTLASHASMIGQNDANGVWDGNTNQWLFRGQTVGDRDRIVQVYDSNGIELANCIVDGDAEYHGRYNYTVYVDDEGYLKLKVGWNNRSGLTYSADEMENNDSLETATEIIGGENVVPNLTIHSADDVDWFKFELETSGRKSNYIGIDFKQWAGDLDISLYNANGKMIDYARSVTDNERLSLSGYMAGAYYLKVSGDKGNTNSYKLVYDLPEPVVLADEYEKGNSPLTNTYLGEIVGSKTVRAAIQAANDVDYFSFRLGHRGTGADSITLSFEPEIGDLDLYLFDISGVFMLGKSVSTNGGSETVSLNGLNRGIYVVKVVGKDGTAANYDLTFNVREDEVDPDRYENNDSMRKATKLYTLNGDKTLTGLSIHSDTDVDYYRFSILEKGSVDDYVTLSYVAQLGDLDIEILNTDGEVVAYSRTAGNDDTVSLKGLDIGEYYVRVYGYNNVANNYTLSWHVTNSALIPSDSYEGNEPITIRENQTISGLTIAKVREEDETREDTFKIVLDYDAWKRSKIILTDYRSDWEEGLSYVIKDADGNVMMEGIDSEISLYGLKKGEYYLTLDAPNEDEYSEYSLISQNLPDSDIAKNNTWSVFIYIAADNNLEGPFLKELLSMQKAILPENVEVYLLMDRSEGYAVGERNWTDTRVGKIRHSNGGAVAVQWMYFDGPETGTYVNANNMELSREWDTGDIATLEAFLDWGMKVGRADNYALIMCDHGTSLGYNCSDEDSDSMMAIKDIAELLKADKYKDISVAAFEQCLMGSDVVVTTMEGTVDYVVASEAVGWVPNLLVMYNVLLNSFETDMTSHGLSQKIVAACNCSGLQNLTMASFKSDGNTLSEALEQFGDLAKDFTFADWVALCKCFSKVHNYGDEICAYSDLGSILNMIKGYHETISSTLLDAANDLYDTVMNIVIDSAQITPDIYGSGLAVFNPVLSDPMMAAYAYGGKSLDYYATDIGKTSWGKFMYTLSKMADDCSDYIVDTSGNLSFTSFTYYFDDGEIRNSYDLGAFSGNGVSFEGLYMDHSAYFNVTLEQAGIEGDAIVVTADNPNAKVTISLYSDSGIRRVFENGVLPLDGIDFEKARTDNDYTLVITTTEETTYDLRFAGNWTTGVDFFDYSRTGSISPLAAGNNSIDKATELPNGNYGGLVTSAGDRDYYKILSVYANTIDVTVTGSGLVVQEFNADGELLQTAAEENGQYKLAVAKENYVCVEGTADIFSGECNSYKLSISDAAQMYLKAELNAVLPEKPVIEGDLKDNQVIVSVNVEDGMKGYSSDDLQTWTECENDSFVATQNGQYYFKSVNPETKLESKYTSLRVVGIDNVLPTVSNVKADVITPTNGNVIVTAEFADDVQLDVAQYRIDECGKWLDYVDGVTVSENATVYFRAIDVAGNTSAIVPYDVTNIDKALPTVSNVQADITDPTKGSVTVTAVFADNIELAQLLYRIGDGAWTAYVDGVTVTENTTVYFKAVDTAGNEAEEAYAVGNIDRDTPVIVVSGDNTTPLKASSLTVTTEAGLDILYSTDGESWTKYEGEITVTANDTYYFMATDAAGNTGRAEYEFRNIDTTPPEKPIASADITTPTKGNVTITATFSADSITKEYSLDGQNWQEYTKSIELSQNGSVYFRGADEAGNISECETYMVNNIDRTPPDKPVATADITEPTNSDVLVSATFSEDSMTKEYSLNGQDWKPYTAPILFLQNGEVYFQGTDAAGNISAVASYTVANINKVAPDKPVATIDVTAPTNTAVHVSAVFNENSVLNEYSLNGTDWTAYTGSIEFTENGPVYFRSRDNAGNVSEVTAYEVTNIDKVAPVAPVASADVTAPTNTDVLVSAVFSADSVVREYSLDGQIWKTYDEAVVFTDNGTVYFRGADAAGNVSDVTSYAVANIDKVAPVKPSASADITTPTNQDVIVSAVFSEDSTKKEYSLDGTTWQAYTEAVKFTENGSVSFRGIDAAGNVSEVTTFEVANIDKVAPEKPVASADITALTNTDVLVSATFSDDSVKREYSLDGTTWRTYVDAICFMVNGTVYFRGSDAAGNVSEVASYTVSNIDKVAPDKPIAMADVTTPTNTNVRVSAIFNEKSVVKEYSLNGTDWVAYTGSIELTDNGTVYFRSEDAAGNVSEITSYEVTNIDKVAPEKPLATADITAVTNQNVTVTAVFSEDSIVQEYSTDGQTWKTYTEPVVFTTNGSAFFRGTDGAGNVSGVTSYEVKNIDTVAPVITLTGDNQMPLKSTTLTAMVDDGSPIIYSTDEVTWQDYTGTIKVTANATYFFKATDAAGNEGTNFLTFANIIYVPVLDVIPQTQTWEQVEEATQYIVEYSTDNFEHVIQMVVDSNSLDSFQMPAGTYQWRVKSEDADDWSVGQTFVAAAESDTPKVVQSNADGNDDLFFATANGTWENIYYAQNVGSINDWTGTNEIISASGKGRIQNLFFGSSDPNVLCLTDGENGDAIFVDDVYTELPESVAEHTARLYKIQEVRAGAGDDIVDMTSQRFEYVGDGLTIRGGDGNDTIWANKGDNFLFGDAGNDRIVGASGNDVIAGGIGNDRMHGGGGNDIFTFGENWGTDTVEQLVSGSVMLWFASGDESKWNAETLTYTDGDNSVKVSGVTADKITLKFGDDGSDRFAALSGKGAFFDATSERIFEESGKGILASLQ